MSKFSSPFMAKSPLRNEEENKTIKLDPVDLGTIKSTNRKPVSSSGAEKLTSSIVDNVTSTILDLKGNQPATSELIKPMAPKADTSVLKSDLGQKAMKSSESAQNESLSNVDRNIAERRSRRQFARAQRKKLRNEMPKGKERRKKIKETRDMQGRDESRMV